MFSLERIFDVRTGWSGMFNRESVKARGAGRGSLFESIAGDLPVYVDWLIWKRREVSLSGFVCTKG